MTLADHVHQGLDPTPYDALLLVSFGGPERSEDVVPFLENVTRGRGIPPERLEEVGQHYFLFGGRSPINDQNRALVEALETDFAEHGLDLPIYWGNRNWDPYLTDTVRQMAEDGVRRAACFVTSAYSSWSGCRQYRENLFDAVEGVQGAPELDKLRAYYHHPGFIEPVVDGVLEALADLPLDVADDARLLFVTHSIPLSMSERSGPPADRTDGPEPRRWDFGEEGAYVAQHRDAMATVVARVAEETGLERSHELVYCSRSGPPHVPWLGPDVNERLVELASEDVPAVLMVPIGFVSDHMEVIYDLDTEAMATAERLGMPARRTATPGTDTRFVAAVRDLLLERAAAERGEPVTRTAVGRFGAFWDRCPVGCCADPGGSRPALCGVESSVDAGETGALA